jgi:hypothetical protein
MNPLRKMKRAWVRLKRAPAGRRFESWYDQEQERGPRSKWVTALKIALSVIALVIGLVEIVFPGPAIFFLVIGGALLASEFRFAARAMDWLERQGRVVLRWIRNAWHRTSAAVHVAVLTLAAALTAAGSYAVYVRLTD